MSTVEVFLDSEDEDAPLFSAEFAFLPRIGEHISRDMQGYFDYYDVVGCMAPTNRSGRTDDSLCGGQTQRLKRGLLSTLSRR